MKKIHLLFYLMLFGFGSSLFAQVKMSNEQYQNLSIEQRSLYEEINLIYSLKTVRINNYLTANPSQKRVYRIDGVSYVITDVVNGNPVYTTLDNLVSSLSSGTNDLNTGGDLGLNLDGTGITVGVWDGGQIQASHTEFLNTTGSQTRVTNVQTENVEGGFDEDPHATHVSGTIGARGVNTLAKGMAPDVTLRNYNFLNDVPEIFTEATDVSFPLLLSNHSYGVPVQQPGGGTLPAWQMGAYSNSARIFDDLSRLSPKFLMVLSAGNGGTTSYSGGLFPGFDKLTGNKNAKNVLIVANAQSNVDGNGDLNSFFINPGSSQGPTDDLRIKPDITGDGTSVISTIPGGGYGTLSGTSMSAPHVTGTIALLQQYYNQLHGDFANSSTMKALVCHTAIDDQTNIGPDPVFGWGFLDGRESAILITNDVNGSALIEELTLENDGEYTLSFSANAGDEVKATICWTDVPGVAATGSDDLNSPTPRLVNDLDLRVSGNGENFLPWRLDFSPTFGFSAVKDDNSVDNIERVDFIAPVTGVYTLNVTHKGSLTPYQSGPQNQDFSLIVTGNNFSLSTNDNEMANSLSIHPNPSNGDFTVGFESSFMNVNDSKVHIEVYDLSGRLIYGKNFVNNGSVFKETISLQDVRSGVYMVNISAGGRTTSNKLIIN